MTHVAGPGEILTYTGRYVRPLRLSPGDVDITDIAHALSMQCRYSGHTSQFYSVAQHSVLCVDWLRKRDYPLEVQRQGLLHDAAEAYLQDMARPLKEDEGFGQAYRDAESWVEQAIFAAYDVDWPYDPAVKTADLSLLALERRELMPSNGHWEVLENVTIPPDIEIRAWPPELAKTFFLREFERLFPNDDQEAPVAEPIFEHDSPFDSDKFSISGIFPGPDNFEGMKILGFDVNAYPDIKVEYLPAGEQPSREEGETVDEYIERLHASDAPANRHPNSARFHELLEHAGETHDRKQEDYGKGDDPFANVRASEDWGVPGWVGAMVRLTDKVKRLQSLRTKGYLANESAKDSFLDIAVYALIAYVLYEQDADAGTL
jgi:hypothetical protein